MTRLARTTLLFAAAIALASLPARAQFITGTVSGTVMFAGAPATHPAGDNGLGLAAYIAETQSYGFVQSDGTFEIDDVPVGSNYTLQVYSDYQVRGNASYRLGSTSNIGAVTEGNVTSADVDLTPTAGVVVGFITVNSVPLQFPFINAGDGNYWLCGADGSFIHYMQPQQLTTAVSTQSNSPVGTISFTIIAGQTTNLHTVDFGTGTISGTAMFMGAAATRPSGDNGLGLAAYIVETQSYGFVNPDGTFEIDNVPVGSSYTLQIYSDYQARGSPSYLLGTTHNVPVTEGATTNATVDMTPTAGLVTGFITVNGATLQFPFINYGDGNYWNCGADGSFFHYMQPQQVTTLVSTQNNSPVGDISFTITAGQITNLNTIDFGTGTIKGTAFFAGAPATRPAGDNGLGLAAYVLEAQSYGFVNPDGTFEIDNVPVGSSYTLQIYSDYQARGSPSYLLGSTHHVPVTEGGTTSANVDMTPTAGLVTGTITENGVPVQFPFINYGDGNYWTCGADGSFAHYMQPQMVTTEVETQGRNPLGTLSFNVIAGQTTDVNLQTVETGQNVIVDSGGYPNSIGGIELQFTAVTAAGTVVTETSGGPNPPFGDRIVGIGGVPTFWSTSTTASYTAPVEVCIHYSPTDVLGDPSALKLEDATNGYIDLTTSVNTVTDIICGQGTTLSQYAIVEPVPPPTISAVSTTTSAGGTLQFQASGGSGASYSWSVLPGGEGGSIDGTGLYKAGAGPGTDTIELTDSYNHSSTITITIVATPLALQMTRGTGSSFEIGSEVVESISINNPGAAAENGVISITLQTSTGFAVVSYDGSSNFDQVTNTPGNYVFEWTGAPLAAGASLPVLAVTLAVQAASSSTASILATVSTSDSSSNSGSSATDTINVVHQPILNLATPTLSIGSMRAGGSTSANLIVSNTGYSELTFTGSATSGFSITGAQQEIDAGDSLQLTVGFSPSAAGPYTGTLTLSSNDPNTPVQTVALSGTGIFPTTRFSSADIEFGEVAVGSSGPQILELDNLGSDTLNLSSAVISGANGSEFTLDSNPAGPMVPAQGSLLIALHFAPASQGARSATLTIVDDNGTYPIGLGGFGLGPLAVAAPTTLQFGQIHTGQTGAAQAAVISNAGSATLQITSAQIIPSTGAFALASGQSSSATVAAGGQASFAVTFAPASSGAASASLQLQTNDPAHATLSIVLQGTGIAAAPALSTTALAFNSVAAGMNSSISISVQNSGNAATVVQAPQISGAGAAVYSISPLTGATIAGGGSASWSVTFAPGNFGSQPATLTFNTDSGMLTATLSGTGTQGVVSLAASTISFGSVLKSTRSEQDVVLTNPGNAQLTLTSAALSGANASDFSLQIGGQPLTSALPIAASGQATLQLFFVPSLLGSEAATLTLNASDGAHALSLSGIGIEGTPSLTPLSSAFGNVVLGASSAQISLSLVNTGDAPFTVSAPTLSGANASDFSATLSTTITAPDGQSQAAGNGNFTLPAGYSGAVLASFTPSAIGARATTVSVATSAGTVTASLSGTGTSPIASSTQSTLSFASVVLGQAASMTWPVENSGTSPLTLQSLAFTSGDASVFNAQLPGVLALAPGVTALIPISFAPTSLAAFASTLTLTTDGGALSLAVSGTGIGPLATATTTALALGAVSLGSQTSGNVSLKNNGDAPLSLSALYFGAPNSGDFSSTQALPATVAAGASLSIPIVFRPAATGARASTLTLVTDGGSVTAQLSGTGLTATLSFSPAALDFGSVAVSAAGALDVVANNDSSSAVTILSATTGGPDAADFAITAPQGFPVALAAGDSVSLQVVFTPQAGGTRAASLSLQLASGASLAPLSLTGIGTAGGLVAAPASLDFGAAAVGAQSSALALALINSSGVSISLSGAVLQGSDASDFSILNLPSLPSAITAGAQLDLQLAVTPASAGARSATLELSLAGGLTLEVPLAAAGVSGELAETPAALDFPSTAVGNSSEPLAVTLSNSGALPVVLTSAAIDGDDAADFNFAGPAPTSLTIPAQGSSTLLIQFAPLVAGDRAATLNLVSDGGSIAIPLSGTALPVGFAVSVDEIAFGSISAGSADLVRSVNATNTGATTLQLLAPVLSGSGAASFSADLQSGNSLAPQETATVAVRFHATGAGAQAATLTLATSDGNSAAISLIGNVEAEQLSGVATALPPTKIGEASPNTAVHINNASDVDVLITGLATSNSQFEIVSPILPALAPHGTGLDVMVVFRPTQTGTVAGNLLVFVGGNTTASSALSIPLSGISVGLNSGCAGGSASVFGLLALALFGRRRARRKLAC